MIHTYVFADGVITFHGVIFLDMEDTGLIPIKKPSMFLICFQSLFPFILSNWQTRNNPFGTVWCFNFLLFLLKNINEGPFYYSHLSVYSCHSRLETLLVTRSMFSNENVRFSFSPWRLFHCSLKSLVIIIILYISLLYRLIIDCVYFCLVMTSAWLGTKICDITC